jgi:branched-chain amino acid transport system substrate-binding protein
VTRANDEHYLFDGTYVTDAAKDQILTGSPAMVVASIREDDTAVGRGSAGPPGVLLPSGESVSIMFDTDATALRIIAMVAPPMAPDNYVSAVVNVANLRSGSVTVPLSRFDIGDNEMTMEISRVDDHMTVGTVTITRKTGPLGAVAVSEDEAVQIRSLLAHTISSLGTASRYGVELAVQDFGMIHGRAVELGERVDGMCGPEGGRAGAEQIVADPQVVGVIGTNCSGAAVTASPVISEAGLVMVSPSNTSPFLTSDLAGNANPNYHPGYFRVDVNDLYKGRAVADFAYDELNLRRTAVIDDGDPYTTALVSAFADAFRALGGEIVATARIQKGRTDMTSVLTQFAAAGPDGIFFPLFEVEGIPFAQQAQAFDGLEGVTLISGAALFISQFLGMPQSQGLYFVSPETELGSNVNEATGKNADAVRTAYEAMYDGSPGSPYWAQSYDATTLLLSAIESVAVKEGRMLYIDRAALREELGMTSDFQALIGVLSCDEFGDCGTGHINIHHHTDSSITDPAQVQVVYRFAP